MLPCAKALQEDVMGNRFDGLRFWAAIGVFVSHGLFLYRFPMPVPFPGHSLGSLSVYVFFFVSGYLVYQSWERTPTWMEFGTKRVARIFPGLVVAVAFSVFVLGWCMTTWDSWGYWSAGATWSNFFNNAAGLATVQTLPGVFEHNPFAAAVNGSLWTIRYELAMYGLMALIALGFGRHRLTWPIVVVTMAMVWWCSSLWSWDETLRSHAAGFAELFRWRDFTGFGVPFFVGAAFAAYRVRARPWMAAIAALAAWTASCTSHEFVRQLSVWVFVTVAIFYAAFAGISSRAAVGRKRMDISYGVYIYAFPIQQTSVEIGLRQEWSLTTYFLVSFSITVCLACISWWVIERPSIQWGQKWLAGGRARHSTNS